MMAEFHTRDELDMLHVLQHTFEHLTHAMRIVGSKDYRGSDPDSWMDIVERDCAEVSEKMGQMNALLRNNRLGLELQRSGH